MELSCSEAEELAHEERMLATAATVHAAIERDKSAVKRKTQFGPWSALFRQMVPELTEHVRQLRTLEDRAPSPNVVRRIREIPASVVAAVTIRYLIELIADRDRVTLRSCYSAVGEALERERTWRAVEREARSLYIAATRAVAGARTWVRAKCMAGIAEHLHIHRWEAGERVGVGALLVELVYDRLAIFEKEVSSQGPRRFTLVVARPELLEWIEGAREAQRSTFPVFLPMLRPPERWAGVYGGGYLHPRAAARPLVKVEEPKDLAVFEGADLSRVLEAVHALQETPWRVNERVLAVAQELWRSKLATLGLPSRDDIPDPPFPPEAETDDKLRLEWRCRRAESRRRNASARALRLRTARILGAANDLRGRALYFPAQLDFRGRIYTLGAPLSFQGPDLARGLLEFAEARPLARRGAVDWFLAGGAARYGAAPPTMRARIEWVSNHESEILALAKDPTGRGAAFLRGADDPWQFLAFAFEYSEWMRDSAHFLSRLPVSMDSTANGLQVVALFLRDGELARATNLLPGLPPQDFYAEVAAATSRGIELEDPVLGSKWRRHFAGDIPRSLAKAAVLPMLFDGTFYAVKLAVEEWFRKNGARPLPFEPRERSPAVWKVIGALYTAASGRCASIRRFQKFTRELAAGYFARGHPVEWTTPSGFPVRHVYRKGDLRTIELRVNGRHKAFRASYHENGEALLKRPFVRALCANFSQSYDAAALVESINLARARGVRAIAAAHDRYATHAADCERLFGALATTYARLFSPSPLAMLAFEMGIRDAPIPLPEIPTVGTFDPAVVERAQHFVA